ncbi:hypothetical protein PUNSTDRAFT_46980 [Punctularia strigosozonata HHB-11173 SS5]|uniref:Uncharacterized protein n=1 Tax=Punctularia strigosozonata (strain HHB-11173) TaxID=741275 RepID=R7S5C8_PUNST|nr:uncharacterized protein PUNSTDRAFT_46980 [Punctularia strigosozonata HHB-11173 SS5]EIN05122.1 hypothetical protein PUNSTDRAFT_46980 [Punctularia strigosozonata HHB-11173 SS5]
MARGVKGYFTAAQSQWFSDHKKEYLAKCGKFKTTAIGEPTPLDDADMKEWRDARWKEFVSLFRDDMKMIKHSDGTDIRAEEWEKMYQRKWINIKATYKPPTEHDRPFFLFSDTAASDFTGRELFRQENHLNINTAANEERARLGLDSKQHAGLYSKHLSAAWNSLSDDQQAVFTDRAIAARDLRSTLQADTSTSLEATYRNQRIFSDTIRRILSGMIGYGPQKIGNATFHLLYTYCDADNMMKSGVSSDTQNNSIDVRPDPSIVPFTERVPNFQKTTKKRWIEYCKEVLYPSTVATTPSTMPSEPSNMHTDAAPSLALSTAPASDATPSSSNNDMSKTAAQLISASGSTSTCATAEPGTEEQPAALRTTGESVLKVPRSITPLTPLPLDDEANINMANTAHGDAPIPSPVPRSPKRRIDATDSEGRGTVKRARGSRPKPPAVHIAEAGRPKRGSKPVNKDYIKSVAIPTTKRRLSERWVYEEADE